jgi:excisionase family DNA binding protein
MGRAYTVASLAAEWECSEGLVRKLIDSGELGCFRLGTLIRIPAEEVVRFECQNIRSSGSEGDMPASGETTRAGEGANDSTPRTALEPRRRPVGAGRSATVLRGQWAGS